MKENNHYTTCRNRVVLPVLLVYACLHANGQQTVIESWQVNEPRPLARAAAILELKYGVQVNYEESIYEFPGDVEDRGRGPESSWFVLRPGTLAWSNIVLKPAHTLVDATGVLQHLVDLHNLNGPGVFKLTQQRGVYFILPVQSKDVNGKSVSRASPLDWPITVSGADRSAYQALKEVCQAVSQAVGVKVVVGTAPTNYILQTHGFVSANDEQGRSVLLRLFDNLQWAHPGIAAVSRTRKLGYQLNYAPETKEYVLNVHIVTVEVPTPSGGSQRQYAEN